MIKSNVIWCIIVITMGILLTALSGLFVSSFLAILGVSIVFWGVIFYYIKPVKQVSLSLINATNIASVDNLNRFLSELEFSQKGIYLPPDKLRDPESSLIFIPKN